jgi:hypothetical protein
MARNSSVETGIAIFIPDERINKKAGRDSLIDSAVF